MTPTAIGEVVHIAVRFKYQSDALILMEAQRFGGFDIVTLDTDMQRARADFNVYIWL